MRRGSRTFAAGLCAIVAATALAACGADEFANDPRPPKPVELTARITDEQVNVSPAEVGAGIVVITVANLAGTGAQLTLDGPTEATSEPIPAGGVGSIKAELAQGRYAVDVEGVTARASRLDVGPERPSSQDELLLP